MSTEIERTSEERKLYCVVVRYGSVANAVYVRGVFHDEAIIMKGFAKKLGYRDAKIVPQEEFYSSRGPGGYVPRTQSSPSQRDRPVHDLRAQS